MAVNPQGVAGVFTLLGFDVPDQRRLNRIAASGRSYTEIRDDLLQFMANRDPNDDIHDVADALADVLDQKFAARGIDDAGVGDETEEQRFDRIVSEIMSGQRTLGEVSKTIAGFGEDTPDAGDDIDDPPGTVGDSTIPSGGELIRVKNPEGSDEAFLYFISYNWRGVQITYEVGGPERFRELFGSTDNFPAFRTISQSQYDDAGFVEAGLIDQELGATESIGARIERETRALGMEDLPDWLSNSQQALALVATATAQEWSSGRLWKELSETSGFVERFGDVIDLYLQENMTIADAVDQIVRDENELRASLRPFLAGADEATQTGFVHDLIKNGWTAGSVAQVAEQMQVLTRDAGRLERTNLILEASGLEQLDEVGFINALNGFGPQDTIEALNTASAAEALDRAGIDLDDEGLRAMLDLVDTSDRLLTVDSFGELAQQLSFNLIRNRHEVDIGKFDLTEDDLIAAAFGRESPNGRSSGETLGLLARLERDRRAAAQGFDQTSGFVDDEGRLRLQGLANL